MQPHRLSLVLFVAAPGLCAQQEADALLRKACQTMQQQTAITFTTSESQDAAMTRRFRHMMPQSAEPTEVKVRQTPGLIHAEIGDDEEILIAGRRCIARSGDGAWELRKGTTTRGLPLPFLFDPELLFEVLDGLPEAARAVQRSEAAKLGDRNLQLVSLTLEGKEAKNLARSGLLPRMAGGPMLLMGGMGRQMQEGGAMTIDAALWVDPETGLVHKLCLRALSTSAMPGNVQIRMGGPGGEEVEAEAEEETPVQEKDAQGQRIYKAGLPVRAVGKDQSVLEFEVRFSGFGLTKSPELSSEASKLLRLPQAK